ncbi:unnamed protein product [Peniophora sp. CBMAI 1063]|nr:unnamed protein product [Peniophora sp. CBMAI 1063]
MDEWPVGPPALSSILLPRSALRELDNTRLAIGIKAPTFLSPPAGPPRCRACLHFIPQTFEAWLRTPAASAAPHEAVSPPSQRSTLLRRLSPPRARLSFSRNTRGTKGLPPPEYARVLRCTFLTCGNADCAARTCDSIGPYFANRETNCSEHNAV